jgi:filamentous hemagglutinin family protein
MTISPPRYLVVPGLASLFLLSESVSPNFRGAYAQLVPDGTLGAESSIVTPDAFVRGDVADLIEGGATRGSALFHSFQDFNVNGGQRVYFANPIGVENILSRVTGLDPSAIDGLLGVDGAANLFFLNPNGIVFGPDAQLDVDGAFLASTSDRFEFADGTEFRATDPNDAPLVTVNIPLGLQLGPDAPAAIESEADLVAGQDLWLSAGAVRSMGLLASRDGAVRVEGLSGDVEVKDVLAQSALLTASNNLVLEESRLLTQGDLTLQADQTVRIRDSQENQFLAAAGGDLRIQGNAEIDILALNHPQTPFQSGGDMFLISDGPISGDAKYFSWGNFSIEGLDGNPGDFFSYFDPIISANGDVTFGNYTGAALKVEATGSITVTGNIEITGPDLAFAGGGAAALGNATETLDGRILITNGSGSVGAFVLENFLDITALNDLGNGNATEGSGLKTAPFNIANDQVFSFGWNFLTNEGNSSSFNDFAFSALVPAPGADAPVATLADTSTVAPPSSTVPVSFFNFQTFGQQTGGTFSFTGGTDGPAGDYILVLGVTDVNDSSVDSGLAISNPALSNDPDFNIDVVQTSDPDLPVLGSSSSLILRAGVDPADIGNPGQIITAPGAVTLSAPGDPVEIDTTFTATAADPTASIEINGNINTTGDVDFEVNPGINYVDEGYTAGSILLSAPGDIDVNGNMTTSADFSVDDGNSGAILITSGGDVTLKDGFQVGRPQGTGSGGNITIEGNSVTLDGYSLDPASLQEGNSGSTTITATDGNVTVNDGIIYGDNGAELPESRGGNISISGSNIDLDNYTLNAINSGVGEGGSISLVADENINFKNFSDVLTDNFNNGIGGDILINAGKDILILDSEVSSNTKSELENGIGGDITVVAGGTLELNASSLKADTEGAARGGLISVSTTSTKLGNASNISTSAEGVGNPGIISVNSETVDLSGDSKITATTLISGGSDGFFDFSGNIFLNNLTSLKVVDSLISASTESGEAGNISVNATDFVELSGVSSSGEGGLSAAANVGGKAGGIQISSPTVTIQDGAATKVSSTLAGDAGGVSIDATTVTLNDGGQITADTEAGTVEQGIKLTNLETLAVNNSLISSSTKTGEAGDIIIDATQSVTVDGTFTLDGDEVGGISVSAGDPDNPGGQGGSIKITTATLDIKNGAAIAANAINDANAGVVSIDASGNFTLENGGQITAETEAGETPQGIKLTSLKTITIKNSLISASTKTGTAGDVILQATESVTVDGTFNLNGEEVGGVKVSADSDIVGQGQGGKIAITTATVDVKNGAAIAASALGEADAGLVFVKADNVTLENGGQITAETEAGETPQGIKLTNLQTLSVNNGLVSASTQTGKAGSILIDASESVTVDGTFDLEGKTVGGISVSAGSENATETGGIGGNIEIETTNVNVNNGAAIAASAINDADAGLVLVEAKNVTLNNGGQIAAETEAGQAAEGIKLQNLETLTVNNSLISASTKTGTAGSITVDASESVSLDGTFNGAPGGISASAGVEGQDKGTGGSIEVKTTVLDIQNGAAIAASAEGGASGGAVTIDTQTATLNNGGNITAATQAGEAVGGIQLNNLQTLSVTNSEISASTETGTAGGVTVNAAQSVALNGPGGITASAGVVGEDDGTGGNINVNTTVLGIQNGAELAASAQGGASGGAVQVNANQVAVNSGGQIAASTQSGDGNAAGILLNGLQTLIVDDGLISTSTDDGKAGGVTVNAANNILLTGRLTDKIAAGISAEATAGGAAGDVNLTTSDFQVRDGAAVTVSSPTGFAGSLTVIADLATLNNGTLSSIAGKGDGTANITIDLSRSPALTNFLRLENESLISASAQGEATGGNITINADFIFGLFPTGPEGSDITADAEFGSGGVISIDAPLGVFGLQVRPERTPLNDITASGGVGGGQGTIAINSLTTSPEEGVVELDLAFVDVSDQTIDRCSPSGDGNGSEINVAGRGGLPPMPTGILSAVADSDDDWVTLASPATDTMMSTMATTMNTLPSTTELSQAPSLCHRGYQAAQMPI